MAKEPRPTGKGATLRCVSDLAAELHMSRSQKITNLLGVTIPFAGFLASIFFLWGSYVTWRDLTIFAVGYALTTLGISIGFHRLFTHRSYETFRSIRYGLAVLGSMAVQGPVIRWVSTTASTTASPTARAIRTRPTPASAPGCAASSPASGTRTSAGSSATSAAPSGRSTRRTCSPTCGMVFVSRWFGLWVGARCSALPRVGLGRHPRRRPAGDVLGRPDPDLPAPPITWSVNSVCHFFGSRRFRVKDESRNVWWLSGSPSASRGTTTTTPSSSAFHGLKPWELDIGGLVIRVMRRLGLVWKVNVPTAEMQQRRLDALS